MDKTLTLNIGLIAAETLSPLTVNDGDTRSVVPHRSVGMSQIILNCL